MRTLFCRAAPAAIALALITPSAWAIDTLVYSFETGGAFNPDGFGPNGGGTITKTLGVGNTVGANSMHEEALPGDTFFGALTQAGLLPVLTSAEVDAIKVDVTLLTPYTGTNATIGVTYFAYHDPDDIPGTGDETAFGTPFQTDNASIQHLDGKAPGTYTLTIPLLEFNSHAPFNGPTLFNNPNPAQDWDLGGFQLTFQKDNTAPLDVYVDNVRAVPEPASIGCLALAGLVVLRRRR
jgi:hypothetical protein